MGRSFLFLASSVAVLFSVFFGVSFLGSGGVAHGFESGFFNKVLGERSYMVYVPEGLPVDADVFVVLHGSGGTAVETSESSGFNVLADRDKFLVVYPQGFGVTPDWNGGGCCGEASAAQVDDVGFVERVVKDVKREFSVGDVFVVGFSSGGVMAYRVGCELSGVVSGVGVSSGSLTLDVCVNDARIPLLHIHGSDDEIVYIDGGVGPDLYNFKSMKDSVEEFSSSGGYSESVIVEHFGHAWLPSNAEMFVNFFNR